ncbi:carboxypeptidase-like regulatory domain-containing protein, partial [bacterium]|nr:carboxypeptidase-like regulatory domain-containing protein [bacterium]
MRGEVCLLISLIALSLLISAGPAAGAEIGNISGVVVDARTGEPVAGATVRVAGLPLGAVADTSGQFVLRGVPAGRQRLRAERIGYARLSQEVTVVAGQEVQVRLAASPEAVPAGEVTVIGERERARDVEQAPTFATVIEAPAFQGRATSLPEV